MDIIVEELIVEEDRPKQIARHGVKIEEVKQIVEGDYVFIQGKYGRWLLIGKTKKGRSLTVVVGERDRKNAYGLVTARSASREERSFHNEFILQTGGEMNGKNKKS